MPRKKSSKSLFYRLLLTALMMPVMGLMAIPPDGDGAGGGGGGDDGGGDEAAKAAAEAEAARKAEEEAKKQAGDDKTHVPRTELDKVISERQAAKEKARALEKELADVKKKAGDTEALTAELEKLKERDKKLAEMEAAEEARKIKDMTEIERLKHENEKLKGTVGELQTQAEKATAEITKKMQDQIDGLSAQNKKLLEHKLGSEIIDAAANSGAHNPKVLVKLLGDQFKVNEEGDYVAEVDGPKGGKLEKSVKEIVESYLSDTANAYLLQPGKGPRKATEPGDSAPGKGGDDTKTGKLTVAEKRDAEMRGMTEKVYYDTVIAPREKALEGQRKKRAEGNGGLLPGQLKMADR